MFAKIYFTCKDFSKEKQRRLTPLLLGSKFKKFEVEVFRHTA